MKTAVAIVCPLFSLLAACTLQSPRHPQIMNPSNPSPEFWLDLVRGEQVSDAAVFADLAAASVVYVGETHTIARHHAIQLWLLQELFARGTGLVLCLEQLQAADQPVVERFNRREIDFATLAREIDWAAQWSNYADYRQLCDFAQQHAIPVRGINAPPNLIRAISRGGGVAHLRPEQRAQLPADLSLDAPDYEQVMNRQLAVHAAVDPAKLRPMFEAQIARDESMATQILAARTTDAARPRTAFVITGAGHVRFGLGTPAGVQRRDPNLVPRIVLITDSGELRLSSAEKSASREIDITHADLRALGRPPGDYLRVRPTASSALPAGHPPIAP